MLTPPSAMTDEHRVDFFAAKGRTGYALADRETGRVDSTTPGAGERAGGAWIRSAAWTGLDTTGDAR